MNKHTLQEWTTPLTIGSFVLSAVTGVLILFHANVGWVKTAHTWFSWLLVAGGIGHVIVNWKLCVGYLTKPLGRVIIAACLLVTLTAFLPLDIGKKGNPFVSMTKALAVMPITDIAPVVKKSPGQLMEELRARNIVVTEEQQTVVEIARSNDKRVLDVLNAIFGTEEDGRISSRI